MKKLLLKLITVHRWSAFPRFILLDMKPCRDHRLLNAFGWEENQADPILKNHFLFDRPGLYRSKKWTIRQIVPTWVIPFDNVSSVTIVSWKILMHKSAIVVGRQRPPLVQAIKPTFGLKMKRKNKTSNLWLRPLFADMSTFKPTPRLWLVTVLKWACLWTDSAAKRSLKIVPDRKLSNCFTTSFDFDLLKRKKNLILRVKTGRVQHYKLAP